jgi:hypothetical protein
LVSYRVFIAVLQRFSAELAAEAAPITSTGAWKEVKVEGVNGNEARKHGTYSCAISSTEERWFPNVLIVF